MNHDQVDEMFRDEIYLREAYQKRASQPMRDGLREALEMALKHVRIEMMNLPEPITDEDLARYAKYANLRIQIEEMLK